MLVSLALGACSTAPAPLAAGPQGSALKPAAVTGLTVHFRKPNTWRGVNVHYWNATTSTGTASSTWPGVVMTDDGDGWYTFTIPNATSSNLLFVDSGNTNNKTADLTRSGEGWYSGSTWSSTRPANNGFTVHVKKPSTWTKANIHYWNVASTPATPNTTWPGVPMSDEGNGWYRFSFTSTTSANLAFVNSGNTAQKTADLTRNKNGWYDPTTGAWSDTDPGTTCTTAPNNPGTLTGQAGSGQVALSWTAPTTGCAVSGYRVYRKLASDTAYTLLTSAPVTGTGYTATGLTNGTAYTFKVVSVNSAGTESTGVTTTQTPVAISTGLTLHFKKPAGWSGANIHYWNATGGTATTSTWPGVAMTAEGNGWYKFTVDATASSLLFVDPANTANKMPDLTRGKEGWYDPATSNWSDTAPGTGCSTTAPVNPSNLSGAPGDTQAFLGWTAPTDCAVSGYKVYRKPASGTTYTLLTPTPVTGTSYTATGLTNGTAYTFKVVAVNSAGTESAGVTTNVTPSTTIVQPRTGDFREESIYFVMTSRFNDGDTSNNVACWDDAQAKNPSTDPCWRGDFKGLIEKLDYIKALGFTAVWITPVVKNASGYDYHGYHALDHSEVDARNLSAGVSFKTLIDEVHKRGMKIVQDIVLNHTSNLGEENLFPMFTKDPSKPDTAQNLVNIAPAGRLPSNYATMTPDAQYAARINAMKSDTTDPNGIFHHEKSLSWESYTVQTGQIAGDCVDLNTENPQVYNYLVNAYNQYIDLGVDAFRVDTVKHISRLTFNKAFNDAFKARGGQNFFMFGEVATRYRQVWNSGIPAISTPFYTWKDSKSYPWSSTDRTVNEASVFQHWNDNTNTATQPSSSNHQLQGNTYRAPDTSTASGMNVIDFPMHWNFANARDAFGVALGGDTTYQDATWNVTYIDSHDYAPDGAPENQRFSLGQDVWAENLSLIFTFRGIPTLYYGSEIEFQKGAPIDVGPNAPLSTTGRAYFGDKIQGNVSVSGFGKYSGATGTLAQTLEHPLAQHVRQLNLLRRAVPALQKGQYSVEGVSGSAMAFKRRYTDANVDSFAVAAVSGDATFSGLPNGTYTDAVTGDVKTVTNGSLSINAPGKGNLRVYVLATAKTPAPGKVVDRAGLTYLR
jgi:glycosidase